MQRNVRVVWSDETALADAVVPLAAEGGRYGCRGVNALLRAEGWQCNHKHAERGRPGSDGPKFVAKVVCCWLGRVGVTTLSMGRGSP